MKEVTRIMIFMYHITPPYHPPIVKIILKRNMSLSIQMIENEEIIKYSSLFTSVLRPKKIRILTLRGPELGQHKDKLDSLHLFGGE